MLDELKRKLASFNKPEAQELQDASSEVITSLQSQLEESVSMIAQLNAALSAKDALLQANAASMEELAGKVAALSQYAEEAEQRAEALKQEAEAKAIDAKRKMLADVIGAQNAGFETTFAAISGLDEAAFGVVVAGFAASFAKEAQSEMFTESGVSGDADLSNAPEEETREMKILREKFANK